MLLVWASRCWWERLENASLGAVLNRDHKATERDGVSAVFSVLAADAGVTAVRVHEPHVHRDAIAAWRAAKEGAHL